MKRIITAVVIALVSCTTPFISQGQISGEVRYKTILESENFVELESQLLFEGSESYFFVKMANVNKKETDDSFELINNNRIEYHFDLTLKRPTRYEVYFNRKDGTILSQSSIFEAGTVKPCVVVEEGGSIDWTIEDEYKQIGSFKVQKATTTFRGRSYIAWFAPEIPISIGPWKFHDLPGLILEVQDKEKGVQFLFSSIKIPYEDKDIIKEPNLGDKIPLKEYIEINNKFEEEFIRLVRSKLPRDLVISDISYNSVKRSIEREY